MLRLFVFIKRRGVSELKGVRIMRGFYTFFLARPRGILSAFIKFQADFGLASRFRLRVKSVRTVVIDERK